jgi:uncharacterized protein involved in outer membrane biogenesis
MKTVLKPMLLIAAILAAVVGIVFCGALFWIKSDHGLQWVQSRINTLIPGEIAIERHRLSLLKPVLDLYGVELRDPQGLALAGLTRLSVELEWQALWRREIRIERALLQGPWTDLTLDEAAGINLMTALVSPVREKETKTPSPGGTGLPFNIVCESIQLTDGRFTFTPSDGATLLKAFGVTLSAKGDLMARSASLELGVDSFQFSSAGIRPEPARIVLNARLNGDTLNVPSLDVASGQTRVRLSGSAENLYTMPLIDSVLSVDGQLAELKSMVNLVGDYNGPVAAKLTTQGTLANPDARLFMTIDDSRIAGQPLDRVEIPATLKDRLVTIDSAALHLAGGAITLNGAVDLREAFPAGFLSPLRNTDAIAYDLNLA